MYFIVFNKILHKATSDPLMRLNHVEKKLCKTLPLSGIGETI